jgi:hypothetical protein
MLLNHTNKSSLTLESVILDFANWRKEPGRPRFIPDYLWDKVFNLLAHYKKSIVLSKLCIATRQLEKKILDKNQTSSEIIKTSHAQQKIEPPSFVKAIITESSQPISFFDVVLAKPNGATLQIQKLSRFDVLKLMEQFTG